MTYPLRNQYHAIRKALQGSLDSLWPRAGFYDVLSPLVENQVPKAVLPVPEGMSEEAQLWLKNWNQQEDKEALYQTRVPCTVDPKLGLLFANGKVVWGSSDKPERERNPRYLGHLGRPSKKLRSAILLHHLHGDNYFHFVVRVLSKLSLLENSCISDNTPLLINEACTRAPVFREAIDSGIFGGREMIVQGPNETIEVENAYLPRPAFYQKRALEWVAKRLRGETKRKTGRPIFTLRSQSAANGRTYRNQDEVSELAGRLGFNVVDPGTFGFLEQVELFSGAPVIAGAHGAALTNIIHRAGQKTAIVEMFSPSMGGPHYYLLSHALGYSYECMLTQEPRGRGFKASTIVDLDHLERSLVLALEKVGIS